MRIFNALLNNSVLRIFLVPQALAAPPGGHLNITEVWWQTLVNSHACGVLWRFSFRFDSGLCSRTPLRGQTVRQEGVLWNYCFGR